MKLGLETESCHLLFQQQGMDIFGFIDLTAKLGLEGVQINVIPDLNLHPVWGTLACAEPAYLAKVKSAIEERDFFCEIDSRGTTTEELEPVLRVAHSLGATRVRSYVRFPGGVFDAGFLAAQVQPVRDLLPLLRRFGVQLAFENHEFETSTEMIDFVDAVGDLDQVGLLCDIGNPMMAWEDPIEAVTAMAPYSFGVHFKDHAVVQDASTHGPPGPVVCGVPLGEGSIDLVRAYRILFEQSRAASINLETCYPYCATFKRPPGTGGAADLCGAFAIADPPFPAAMIQPMDYYYPHTQGQTVTDVLIGRQLEDLHTSAARLLGLREAIEGPAGGAGVPQL